MTILIVGATGQIARPVVGKLAQMGVGTRSLVRDRSKAEAVLRSSGDSLSTEIVELNDGSPSEIEAALENVDRVLLSTGVLSVEEREIQKHIIDAASRRSVAQIVRIAVLSTSRNSRGLVQRFHAELDAYLAESGVSYVSLRPAIFQSTLLTYAPEIRERDYWIGSCPTGRNAFIHPQDVSNAAIAVLLNASRENRVYDLTGPDLLRYDEVANLLTLELGRSIKYVAVPAEQHKAILAERGANSQRIDLLLSRDAAGEANENARMTDDVKKLTGRDPISLAAYFHEARSAFEARRPDA